MRAAGFYRVLYDDPLFERLLAGWAEVPGEERWAVVNDAAAFLASGDSPPERYYRILDAGQSDTDPAVAFELASQLASTSPGRPLLVLGALLGDRAPFRARASAFLAAQVRRLGLVARPGEGELDPVVRGMVVTSAVPFDRGLQGELANRFPQYSDVAPDLRWPVAFSYAGTGGAGEFEALLKALAASKIEGESLRLERALARFPDPALVARALDLALTPVFNRAHLPNVLREAAMNPAGRAVTWAWIQENLHRVEDDYKGTDVIGTSLQHCLPFVGLGRGAEVRQEILDHPFKEGVRGAAKGLALLELYERLLWVVG